MKTRFVRANIPVSVNDLILKVRESSVDLSGTLQVVFESLKRLPKDGAGKGKKNGLGI